MTAQTVTPYDPQFAAAGVANNVDPDLLAAQAAVESSYNPSAVSPAGAQGLMQIMPTTGKALGVTNPMDPGQSINGGAKLMGQLIGQYGNVPDALRAYAGGQNQANWGPVTQAYPGKVAAAYADIKRAGGIQYAQADTGTATDANTVAPVSGRPSDAAMMQMLTGSGAPSTASASSSPPAAMGPDASASPSSSTVAPIAGRPSDAAMMQMMTGGGASAPPSSNSGAPAASSSSTAATSSPANAAAPAAPGGDVTQFPIVAPHLAPDGSGEMTNLSDPDYYRFTGKAPPPAPVAAPAATAPASAPGASAASPAAAPQGSASSGPGMPPTMAQAALSGALDAGRGIDRTVANAANWVDQRAPWLADADNWIGLNPGQMSANLASDIAAHRQAYGSSPAYTAGNIGGNVLATIPLMAAGGAGFGVLGDAASSIPGVGDLLSGAGSAVRAVPGGGLVTSLLANGAKGALQGAGAATATSGGSNQPFLQQVKQGAEFGGVAGAALPAAFGAIKGVGGAVLGGSTDAETAALAQQAKGYGIPITVGQLSNNASVRALDSMSKRVPFSGSDSQAAAQQGAFNRAVGGTIGQPVAKITPQVMTTAKQQIGATLNTIENSNPVSLDGPFLTQIASIEKNAQASLTDPEFKVVSRQLDNILTNLQQGDTIAGQTYGNLIHKGSPLDAALNSRDSNVANYAGQIKGALQDALTRSLSPADQAAYTQARYQYKNLKTIEGLVEKSPTGDISPGGLMQAVRSSFGDMAYSGGGDLGNLARIGQRFLKEPPDSGTAGRLTALEALTRAGGVAGGVLTGATHPGDAAALGAAAVGTLGLARGTRAYLGSQTLANRLIQRGLNPNTVPGLASRLAGVTTAGSPMVAALTGNRLLQPGQSNAQGR